jgi:hypothetical protein
LKQIGIASQNFHGVKGGFPRSRTLCYHSSWAAELWPYLEEGAALELYDSQKTWWLQPLEVRQVQVPGYYCPSRRSSPQFSEVGQDNRGSAVTGIDGALADYAGNAGTGKNNLNQNTLDYYSFHPTSTSQGKANGIILAHPTATSDCGGSRGSRDEGWLFVGEKTYVSIKNVTDGSSKTLLFGEKHVPEYGYGYYANPPSKNIAVYDSSIYNPDDYRVVTRFAGPAYPLAISSTEDVNLNFGGPHPDICQFVFADGHASAVPASIDPVVLGYLAIREDGNSVAAP